MPTNFKNLKTLLRIRVPFPPTVSKYPRTVASNDNCSDDDDDDDDDDDSNDDDDDDDGNDDGTLVVCSFLLFS